LLRIGGEASVTTSPGDGTEVSLRVTREPTTGEMVAP
jgi:hypothetical protein